MRKHFLPAAILVSLALLLTATRLYPGGSDFDQNSTGFRWTENYLSNLFRDQAINGMANPARPWAVAGMAFLSFSIGLFYLQYAKLIPSKHGALVVRFAGVMAMVATALVTTRYHDQAVQVSATLGLLSMFYITVYLFRSNLRWLRILSLVTLVFAYVSCFIYFTSTRLDLLPMMQKVTLLLKITWVLCLYYFSSAENFFPEKKRVKA